MDDTMKGRTGPGACYASKSSFGSQTLAGKRTSASHTFGTKSNKPLNKEDVPGPGSYGIENGFGRQTLSLRQSARTAALDRGNRWSELKKDFRQSEFTPGALNPKVRGQVGDAPGVVMHGKGGRYDMSKGGVPGMKPTALQTPGPGTYGLDSTFGRQTVARHATSATARFGRATREQCDKQYISFGHEKDMFGKHSPGPTTSRPGSAFGSQAPSGRRTTAAFSFGSGDRFSDFKPSQRTLKKTGGDPKKVPVNSIERTPGPGEYLV
ncbi:unnamed protein product [Pedinophyceae sp. YPF-701]|nr:unnamed protein product [Pedinophyceae sp. YPF-701]